MEEKVIIKRDRKVVDGWNPTIKKLPDIVKKYLKEYLSPQDYQHRQDVIRLAIAGFVRDGMATKTTTTLYLTSADGEAETKPFTFYKLKKE